MTKEERSEYNRQYRLKNLERIKEKDRLYGIEYRAKNKEQIKAKRDTKKDLAVKRAKDWAKANPEKVRANKRELYKKNRDKNLVYYRNYRAKNRDQINNVISKWTKERVKTDELFRLKKNLRNRVYLFLKQKGYFKSAKTEQILGCSFEYFKQHIESKWEPWMNWDNYGKYNGEVNYGWDIDHIIELSEAKTPDDILRLCHFSNTQPLCSKINREIKNRHARGFSL